MRLISAEEANKAIETLCNEYGISYGNKYGGFGEKIASVINGVPTVEAEPVTHAHWVLVSTRQLVSSDACHKVYKCSACGRKIILQSPLEDFPYCHCGAKMNGGVNNEVQNR